MSEWWWPVVGIVGLLATIGGFGSLIIDALREYAADRNG